MATWLINYLKFIFYYYYLEITHYSIDPNKDKFIVIGSDGLWEYISNEEVNKNLLFIINFIVVY